MASVLTADRTRSAASSSLLGAGVLFLALVGGYVFARLSFPAVHSRMFPWIAGRALGLSGYLTLTALVTTGIWHRHPWRHRFRLVSAETRLRFHASLAAATIVLIVGHMAVLATDSYAGVGWWGALVPGMSHYRTLPVSLGVVAFVGLVVVGATASLAGRLFGSAWFKIHKLAMPTFALVWLHGVFSGADTHTLRLGYLLTGAMVPVLFATSKLVRSER